LKAWRDIALGALYVVLVVHGDHVAWSKGPLVAMPAGNVLLLPRSYVGARISVVSSKTAVGMSKCPYAVHDRL
jgi:hypothetical protein